MKISQLLLISSIFASTSFVAMQFPQADAARSCLGTQAECACESALDLGTRRAMSNFLRQYPRADTICNATASTIPVGGANRRDGLNTGSSGTPVSSSSNGGSSSSNGGSSSSNGGSSSSNGGSSSSNGGSSSSNGGSSSSNGGHSSGGHSSGGHGDGCRGGGGGNCGIGHGSSGGNGTHNEGNGYGPKKN